MGDNNFKSGTEPDGFRGIQWGTDVSDLSGIHHCRTDSDSEYSNIEIYEKQNDEMRIGGAVLERIEYCFWQGKFYSIQVYAQGKQDIEYLKEAVFEKFGDGGHEDKYFKFGAILRWSGTITEMYLQGHRYFFDRNSSNFGMISVEIKKLKTAYEEKQKDLERIEREKLAKEGAEKGF